MNIAIVTTFQELNPGYSLTSIVQDQVTMLVRNAHTVHLVVSEVYNDAVLPGAQIHKIIPFAHLHDYTNETTVKEEHRQTVVDTAELLKDFLTYYNIDIVLTHDLLFQGWFFPYACGILALRDQFPSVRWFHWVHSVPSPPGKPWWNIKAYGHRHKLVFPNKTDALRVAELFHGELEDVRVIPHIKDPRTWFDFSAETNDLIDYYPLLMQADVVQVLPASTDRLTGKNLNAVIDIFAAIKEMNFSVCLFVANQWATTTQRTEELQPFIHRAYEKGLDIGSEFVFSSAALAGQYQAGLPKRVLRELMSLSNLFVFPTLEESFGLVVPEIALSSGAFCVLNKSLAMMPEVTGYHALYANFGSFHINHVVPDPEKYYADLANIVMGRMRQNESLMLRTYMRQMYNYDKIYNHYYALLFAESATW